MPRDRHMSIRRPSHVIVLIVALLAQLAFIEDAVPFELLGQQGRLEVVEVIDELRKEGMTILVVSSDIDEVLLIADRVLVMRKRKSVGVLEGANITHGSLLRLAFGEAPDEAA